MNLVEVHEIRHLASDLILDGALDAPVAGYQQTYTLEIRGWLLGHATPAVELKLLNAQGSDQLAHTTVSLFRGDVAKRYPQKTPHCGFHLRFSLLGQPLNFEFQLQVIFQDHSCATFARVHIVRQQALGSIYRPQRQPLMVTSLGRCGSTWLMHLLAHHPHIHVYSRYPYEAYAAKYWFYNVFRLLTQPETQLQESQSPKKIFNLTLQWFNRNIHTQAPLQHWFVHHYLTEVAGFCQRSIDCFYDTVAKPQRTHWWQPKQRCYFAEKFGPGPRFLTGLFHELYPQAREIILVRDFRDMLCSMLAFNAPAFGFEGAPFEGAVAEIKVRAQRLHDYALLRQQQAYLVYYENLMLQPVDTLSQIFNYLNLATPSQHLEHWLDTIEPITAQHQTRPQNSIGRWRYELTEHQQAQCRQQLHTELHAFHYIK